MTRNGVSTTANLKLVSAFLLSVCCIVLLAFTGNVSAAPAPFHLEDLNIDARSGPAQPRPVARARPTGVAAVARSPQITQAPTYPQARKAATPQADLDAVLRWYQEEQKQAKRREDAPTRIQKRDETPPVPLSQLGPPSFPAQYPSCVKCEAKYSSLSSCMQASAVFQNATSIFNNPLSYFAVIKCACTDTFQAVYPQCLDCFQHTDQCWYLGTDPQGTGAPAIISNIRNICAFGSGLLGGVATANGMNQTSTVSGPSAPGTYTDVSATNYAPGYNDQSTGPIFGSAGRSVQGQGRIGAVVAGAIGIGLIGQLL
ncbi:hypothetical protein OC846_001468 [Tilletia horrida]|uniref:Uncharacterized protein n=1 Tax=Tilletia horrida TaxID=155126 RepID=A0AAN6JT07_9BASI|nr:hypothetical protein OC846_001468 [Tilletia horrida]KAK0569004.1 hypothetical protein OC861_001345 [Tilletia horrida]